MKLHCNSRSLNCYWLAAVKWFKMTLLEILFTGRCFIFIWVEVLQEHIISKYVDEGCNTRLYLLGVITAVQCAVSHRWETCVVMCQGTVQVGFIDPGAIVQHKLVGHAIWNIQFVFNCWFIVDSTQYRWYLDLPRLMVGKFGINHRQSAGTRHPRRTI